MCYIYIRSVVGVRSAGQFKIRNTVDNMKSACIISKFGRKNIFVWRNIGSENKSSNFIKICQFLLYGTFATVIDKI